MGCGKQHENVEMVWLESPRGGAIFRSLINKCRAFVARWQILPDWARSNQNQAKATQPTNSTTAASDFLSISLVSNMKLTLFKPGGRHARNSFTLRQMSGCWIRIPDSDTFNQSAKDSRSLFSTPLTAMERMPMPLNKCHYIVKCILAP